jgi:hypothetical protein
MFKNMAEVFALFGDALRADECCVHCGAVLSRHGWTVLDGDGSDKTLDLVMPECPDGSERRYEAPRR